MAVQCLNCKYDLRNLTEHRCPECGKEFDPNNPTTFYCSEKVAQHKRRIRMLWTAVFVTLFAAYFLWLYATDPTDSPNFLKHLRVSFGFASGQVILAWLLVTFIAWYARGIRKHATKQAG